MLKYLDVRVCVVFAIFCTYKVLSSSCGECDPDSCQPPQGCLTGMIKDDCNCCFVCGRREGERCDNKELNFVGFGKCGDNLECRVRNDLDWDDPPEAVCVCLSQTPLCGSDDVTYENECQFQEARYRRRGDDLRKVSAGPCAKPARITTVPHNIVNSMGNSAAMSCEANAWPAPTIKWFVKRNGTLHELPGNSTRIAVQSRSGPDVDETTSWLYFLRIEKEDEGLYICKADNNAGSATANATVTVSS